MSQRFPRCFFEGLLSAGKIGDRGILGLVVFGVALFVSGAGGIPVCILVHGRIFYHRMVGGFFPSVGNGVPSQPRCGAGAGDPIQGDGGLII